MNTTPTPGATRAARALLIKNKHAVRAAALVIDTETRLPELLDWLAEFLEEFSVWEGPEEEATTEAGHNRNRSVRLYERARALLSAHKQHRHEKGTA